MNMQYLYINSGVVTKELTEYDNSITHDELCFVDEAGSYRYNNGTIEDYDVNTVYSRNYVYHCPAWDKNVCYGIWEEQYAQMILDAASAIDAVNNDWSMSQSDKNKRLSELNVLSSTYTYTKQIYTDLLAR